MRKLRILVDMDSILADFLEGLWDVIEADTGYRPKTENVKNFFRMQDALPAGAGIHMGKTGKTIESYFHAPGFFEGLKPIPGAQDAIQKLVDAGHEIVIVSTPSSKTSAQEKLNWMAEHFPMVPAAHVCVFGKKHMIKGDVLIDDAVHNAEAYAKEWPTARLLTPAYPYNLVGGYVFHGRYDMHPEAAWEMIVQDIGILAEILEATGRESALWKPLKSAQDGR